MRLLACLALLAGPALAQEEPHYDPDVLRTCLAATDWGDCISVAADACLATDAGSTTLGVGYCYNAAWEDWDKRLNETYAEAVRQARDLDADNAEGPYDLASSEEALRTAQRAWIAFRDAACEYEGTRWSGGTGGGPASAQCLMDLTARQTVFLRDRLW